MRFHKLVLPIVVLSNVCAAAPSPSSQDCQTTLTTRPTASREISKWRKISGRIIGSLWKKELQQSCVVDLDNPKRLRATKLAPIRAPAHTAARYGADVLLRFNVSTAEELESLKDATDTLLLDVWEFTSSSVDLRLAKDLVPSLLSLLPVTLQHAYMSLLPDIGLAQAVFDTYPNYTYPEPREVRTRAAAQHTLARPAHFDQRAKVQPDGKTFGGDINLFFGEYQPLTVIEPWLSLMASIFPTHARLITIGHSAEKRPISALRIGVHPTNRKHESPPKRKTILITAGLHAREWISTSTATFVAFSLMTGYGKNSDITQLLQDFDFVIVPTLNPDGYTYTWTTDRLWRKTRQPTSLRFCPGIDLDHSFNFSFPVTSANNPCSEAFAGESAFEATESKALAVWAKNETENHNVEFVSLLDLHSYSQQILYPYAYSCEASPPGLEDLEELAYGLEKSIRRSGGHAYEVLPACEGNSIATSSKKTLLPQLEHTGGSMLDYFYHELRVRYAYQVKLRDRGTYGFLLPKEDIIPVGREVFEAVLYLGGFLQESLGLKDATSEAEEDENPDTETASEEVETVEEWLIIDEEAAMDDEEVEDRNRRADLRRRRRR